jgi:predicted nuclease of predicted toxin-antitoxin system
MSERISKTHVNFYKEKGASEAYHLRKKGLDQVEDVEIQIYSQRRYSIIDLERKLTKNLTILSKS